MNRWNGLILALVAAVVTACASGGGGDVGDPGGNEPRDNQQTRIAGVALAKAVTSEGEAATQAYREALAASLEAIRMAPTNPKAYLLAAQASIGVDDWVQADTMFEKAVEIYPAYEETVRSERESGWVRAHNKGIEAVQNGEIERAIELFEAADMLYQGRQEARMNLGWAYAQQGEFEQAVEAYLGALDILWGPAAENIPEDKVAEWESDEEIAAFNAAQYLANVGDYDQAAEVMQRYMDENEGTLAQSQHLQALSARANFLAAAGRGEEAAALYDELLSRDDLTSADYFQIGVGFFTNEEYDRAADAFKRSLTLNPYSRDALLNLVQSHFSEALALEQEAANDTAATEAVIQEREARLAEIYDQILENAQQFREFDPLNRNIMRFMLRAYRGQNDLGIGDGTEVTRNIQELYAIYEGLPWEVRNLALTVQADGNTTLQGELVTVAGEPGTEVELSFTIMDQNGNALATDTVSVTAAPATQAATFSTQLDTSGGTVAGVKYELVQ